MKYFLKKIHDLIAAGGRIRGVAVTFIMNGRCGQMGFGTARTATSKHLKCLVPGTYFRSVSELR